MVRGVAKFKEHFGKYTGQYAFIGGTACDIILGKLGADFRATKDLDIVLLIEVVDADFVTELITFIKGGGYSHINKGTGENQFYRFEKPEDSSFPYMIELFSRKPDFLKDLDAKLAPVHISDDVVSLSAILLDEAYYGLLKEGVVVIDEVSVLNLEYLILFKMKAWLDLSKRKNEGETVDTKNIKKHKNDVFRLAANIEKNTFIPVSGTVRADAIQFVKLLEKDDVDLKSLGIHDTTYKELMDSIKRCYGLV